MAESAAWLKIMPALVQREFGLEVKSSSFLPSFMDTNFHVHSDTTSGRFTDTNGYLVKFYNLGDSQSPWIIGLFCLILQLSCNHCWTLNCLSVCLFLCLLICVSVLMHVSLSSIFTGVGPVKNWMGPTLFFTTSTHGTVVSTFRIYCALL